MLGGTLYLVGRDARSGALLSPAAPCAMCRRYIINAGIRQVIARTDNDEYIITPVSEWIEHDDSLA